MKKQFLALTLSLVFSASAFAVPTVYTLTSGPLTPPVGSGFPAGITGLSISVTADLSAILPNSNFVDFGSSVIDYLSDDGVTSISSTTPGYDVFARVSTDAVGDVILMSFGLIADSTNSGASIPFRHLVTAGPQIPGEAQITYCRFLTSGACRPQSFSQADSRSASFVSNPVNVSEPGTLGLLVLGLTGLALARRRR